MVSSYKGLSAHLTLVRFLACVYFHVLPPATALHKSPPTVLAHEWTVARVGAHVIPQTLGRAQLLATFWTLHASVQTDGLILRFGVIRFVAQMRTLPPRRLEILPTVSATEIAFSGNHRHVVPSLAVIL